MFLRQVYDDALAQAAYLIGCQRTGEAIVIDPERDVDRYIALAAKEGLRITAVAETHIHADFLSGTRELAEKVGAKVYVSDEGDADWKYGWLAARSESANVRECESAKERQSDGAKGASGGYKHQLLKHGDVFKVGNIEFKAMHTPGHTPEHICFMVTDRGGGASEPMGLISGDFVFVGDLGRPDLLETAAGVVGAKDESARRLFASVRRFVELPEFLQVWPAHGAGSACGKALGAVPQTTVGYEKRFNPAILAAASERGFVDSILSGQPEPPMYFARMKRQNRDGPRVLGELPRPVSVSATELAKLDGRKVAIVDTRPWKAFKAGHAPGALFAPLDNMFLMVVGSYVGEDEDIYLIAEAGRVGEIVRSLVRIGLDRVKGFMEPSLMEQYGAAGGRMVTTAEVDVSAAKALLESDRVFALDVRRADEFGAGHIGSATNVAYTRLPAHLEKIPKGKHVLVNCRSGARSGRACAYLQGQGYEVTNLGGGYLAWEAAEK